MQKMTMTAPVMPDHRPKWLREAEHAPVTLTYEPPAGQPAAEPVSRRGYLCPVCVAPIKVRDKYAKIAHCKGCHSTSTIAHDKPLAEQHRT